VAPKLAQAEKLIAQHHDIQNPILDIFVSVDKFCDVKKSRTMASRNRAIANCDWKQSSPRAKDDRNATLFPNGRAP